MDKHTVGTRVLSNSVDDLKGTVEKVLENDTHDYVIGWDIGMQSHVMADAFTVILKKDGTPLMKRRSKWEMQHAVAAR